MINKKRIILITGAAVVLIGAIAASYLSTKESGKEEDKPQSEKSYEREEKKKYGEDRSLQKEEKQKNDIKVYDLDSIYYLFPETAQDFKKRLNHFLNKEDIQATEAYVLEFHSNQRDHLEEPAVFYLKLNDDKNSVVAVSFVKSTGDYSFAKYKGNENSLAYEKETLAEEDIDYEIPESSNTVHLPKNPVHIKDPEKQLKGIADKKELKKELKSFLISEGEGRRNLYVESVVETKNGYEANLVFEIVRCDGRNVEVTYDGSYHFQLL